MQHKLCSIRHHEIKKKIIVVYNFCERSMWKNGLMRDCFFKQVFRCQLSYKTKFENKKCLFHQDLGMELLLLLPEISPGKL